MPLTQMSGQDEMGIVPHSEANKENEQNNI